MKFLQNNFYIISAIFLSISACSSSNWIEVDLADNTFFEKEASYRSDTIDIPLAANDALEYMLVMNHGNAVSYNWAANNLQDAEKLLVEFHGHTIRTTDAPGDLMFYNQARVDSFQGYLVAPFNGIHGWYFANESDRDITITLNLSGFYELEPDEEK